ncbi:MAG: hypothetical protein DRN61_00305 [Thaumarchaeota archaeon]|nr:MAG: hypothetical protein DRN61_00305 [Nitrososphaerota archaeon]
MNTNGKRGGRDIKVIIFAPLVGRFGTRREPTFNEDLDQGSQRAHGEKTSAYLEERGCGVLRADISEPAEIRVEVSSLDDRLRRTIKLRRKRGLCYELIERLRASPR